MNKSEFVGGRLGPARLPHPRTKKSESTGAQIDMNKSEFVGMNVVETMMNKAELVGA